MTTVEREDGPLARLVRGLADAVYHLQRLATPASDVTWTASGGKIATRWATFQPEPEASNPDLCAFFVAVGILLTRGQVQAHNGKLIRTGGLYFRSPQPQGLRPLRTKVYG